MNPPVPEFSLFVPRRAVLSLPGDDQFEDDVALPIDPLSECTSPADPPSALLLLAVDDFDSMRLLRGRGELSGVLSISLNACRFERTVIDKCVVARSTSSAMRLALAMSAP